MGRIGVLVGMVVLFVVLPFGRQAVELYTDWLWFGEVGFSGVFATILSTKILLGAGTGILAFLVLYLNLLATRRGHGPLVELAGEDDLPQLPSWRQVEPLYRKFLLPGCLVIAFMLSGQGTARWETWIRFRNAGTFGVTEPLFGRDVGFYVFTYPLLLGVFQFLTLVLSVTLAAVAAVYVFSRGARLTPRGLVVVPWAKGHLLGLGAAFLVVKAWGYLLDAFGLLFSAGGASFGASYADVNASLPALHAMIGLAGLAAILCLVQMTRPGLRFAFVGLALWIAGGLIGLAAYPAVVQRFRVAPNEIVAERPYIERTIAATNRAYGLDRIESRPFPAEENLTAAVLRKNDTTIKNIRLWEHRPAARLLRSAPGDPHLLQVRRRGQRPLPDRRGVPAGDAVGPRALVRAPSEPDLDQRAPRVHPRLRRRGGTGEPRHAGGAAGVLRQGHPARRPPARSRSAGPRSTTASSPTRTCWSRRARRS